MAFETLIRPDQLAQHLTDPDWAVIDCRFSLADPEQGRREYLKAHIPGAPYAHLDEDLCSPVIRGKTGRHPLPEVEQLVERFSSWGIDERVQVVAYDDAGGAMAAARLWWLLRWLGHSRSAMLDGGWQAWLAGGYRVQAGQTNRLRRYFTASLDPTMVAGKEQVAANQELRLRLLDARAEARFRGENETIDPVAGHIPGACPAPYAMNLDSRGRFLSPEELRDRYSELLSGASPHEAVFYCGSGVTAAHNVLAMMHAGLGMARLYPGSWSEWILDPGCPVETGPAPGGAQ